MYRLKEPQLNKFDIDYEGPYEITGIDYNTKNAKLQNGKIVKIVHLDILKRASLIKVRPPAL